MVKFAMAASSASEPGGPLCVNLAVPVRLRATARAIVLVVVVCPAATLIGNAETTAPVGSNRVSVPLKAALVVFWNE